MELKTTLLFVSGEQHFYLSPLERLENGADH